MDTPLILLLMTAFAFFAHTIERRLLGARHRPLGGAEYLLIGFICGPHALGLLTPERLAALDVVLTFAGGFIGFGCGLPLQSRSRARGPDVTFGAITAVLTTALVGGLAMLALDRVATGSGVIEAALTLGFAAAISSPSTLRSAAIEHRADGPVSRLLPTASRVGRLLGVLGFGAVMAASPVLHQPVHGLPIATWILVPVLAGVGCGLIFHVFVGDQTDKQRLLVASLGLIALASGIGEALRLSPLFIGVVAGATLSAVSPATPRVADTVLRLERPTIVVLFLYGGARFSPHGLIEWAFPIAFVACRLLSLQVAAWVAARFHPDLRGATRGLGRGFGLQGALAAAIALSYGNAMGGSLGRLLETTLLLAAVLNTLISWTAASDLLKDAGETGRARPDMARPTELTHGSGG